MEQQQTISLEYHEVKRIYDYLSISSRKNDTTLPKVKSILKHLEESKHPSSAVCKITVEEK